MRATVSGGETFHAFRLAEQNVAHAAMLAGHHVLFTTAAQLLLDLGSQESAHSLARRLQYYATRGLLVIDEIGYLSYDAGPPICSFRSSAGGTSAAAASLSPPISPSVNGRRSSPAPPPPRR